MMQVTSKMRYFNKVASLDDFLTLYKEYKSYKIFNLDPSLGPNFINILGLTFEYKYLNSTGIYHQVISIRIVKTS